MKRNLLSLLMLAWTVMASAQMPGWGQPAVEPDWKDINYAGDDLEAHRLDIYLPKTGQKKYKVIIAIYGSAWFANNMKGMTYMSIGKPLTEAGFAVVCINHRSSADAKYPAQIQDVKAAIRYVRAHASDYHLDTSFVGITGFSSGGHLASMAGVTNGMTTRTSGNVTIDLIGGVDLYVDKDMHYEDPYADLKIDIKHGYQHLDGNKSGQYVRFRSDELGDIGRVQRQQKFLKALGLQMFSIENIAKIPKILTTAKGYIETDMDTVTMLKAIRSFNILADNNIRSGMLYGNFYDSPTSGISYWRTTRPEIEKSLKEVNIPFMPVQEGGTDTDPVDGVEAATADAYAGEPRRTNSSSQKRALPKSDSQKTGAKESEVRKPQTTQTAKPQPAQKETKRAPVISNTPKTAPKKNAPPVIRKPVISNKPQSAAKN